MTITSSIQQRPPQITVTNCTFIGVGKQSWGPAIDVTGNGVTIANSVIAAPDLLTWRSFARYKTRNVRRALHTFLRTIKKKRTHR